MVTVNGSDGDFFNDVFSCSSKKGNDNSPLVLSAINKSPAVFIFIRELDDLLRENRGSVNRLEK